MQLYDPTTPPKIQQNLRAPAPETLTGLKLGLLSNGKQNADHLLRITAAHFAKNNGCVVQDIRYKANASAPASAEMMAELTENCDILLTANGD